MYTCVFWRVYKYFFLFMYVCIYVCNYAQLCKLETDEVIKYLKI